MTTTLNKISASIEELLKLKKFEEIFNVFTENNLSPEELIVFYKRYKKIQPSKNLLFLTKEYWHSNLPFLHLQKVIESDLKVTFFNSYFLNDDFCNDNLNKHIFEINKAEFIRFIKFTRAFHKPNFWGSLNNLKYEFTELQNLVHELTVINRKIDKVCADSKNNDDILLKFSLMEIVTGFTILHHSFKHQDNVSGNKGFQTEIEMTLIEELGRIIYTFFNLNKKECTIPFTTNSELHTHFISKINSIGRDLKTSFLFERINEMIDTKALGGKIDWYCCGYAELKIQENESFILETNHSYSDFVFNNKKSTPEEFYIGDVSINSSIKALINNTRASGEDEIKYFEYYGIPTKIEFENRTIDLRKVFKLLKHFSVYKSPSEPSNVVPENFRIVFGGNEAISLFDYTSLINNISIFFEWEKVECEVIMRFLSTNFDIEYKEANWLANPFIISEGKVLWLGTFLRDRRWENIVLNKIKSEKALEPYVKVISKNLELNTINLFKKAGFKAFGIDRFKTTTGRRGDIDVLAYKNGCLIIAEVKSGSRSDGFAHARFSEIVRLEGSAAEQLAKIEEYVKDDWENIKKEFGIESRKPFEKIKVYPMIITDYFEGDLELYKDKYSKVSLLELDVIINNSKERLLKAYYQMQLFSNFNNPNFNTKPIKLNYDLWNGKKNISVESVIDKIDTNAVWKEIGTIWNLDLLKVKI